jgi:hypothetical protein
MMPMPGRSMTSDTTAATLLETSLASVSFLHGLAGRVRLARNFAMVGILSCSHQSARSQRRSTGSRIPSPLSAMTLPASVTSALSSVDTTVDAVATSFATHTRTSSCLLTRTPTSTHVPHPLAPATIASTSSVLGTAAIARSLPVIPRQEQPEVPMQVAARHPRQLLLQVARRWHLLPKSLQVFPETGTGALSKSTTCDRLTAGLCSSDITRSL